MPEPEVTEQPQENEAPEVSAEPIVETPAETISPEPEPEVTEQADPVAEEGVAPEVAPEDETAQEPVAEVPGEITEPTEHPDLYTVQAADLNAYPELSQQGVQLYDQVPYGSLYVNKWATAEQLGTVSEAWPRKVGDTTQGITFKG